MGKTSLAPSRTYTGTMGMCLFKSAAMRSQCMSYYVLFIVFRPLLHILPPLVINIIHLQENSMKIEAI